MKKLHQHQSPCRHPSPDPWANRIRTAALAGPLFTAWLLMLALAGPARSADDPAAAPATQPSAGAAKDALPATAPAGAIETPATQPTTQPAATQPATQATATTRPSTRPNGPRGITTRPGGGIMLHFQDASIDSVLDELASVAGFTVIKEVKTEGRIPELISKEPVTPAEAVPLLNSVLKNFGYAAIQQEARILKIVARDKAKRANIPVFKGSDPKAIRATDELITQVISLKYADAMQLKADLAPLISSDADFTANASSNSLVITDTSANIKRVVEIVSALDQNLADSAEVKVFLLKYANATAASKLITDVFQDQTQAGRGMGMPFGGFRGMFGRMGGGGGMPGGGGTVPGTDISAGRRVPRVTASADERTNTLVVSGPAETLKLIAKVVDEIDNNPAAEETVFIYRLKNATALNVEQVMNNMFNLQGGGARSGMQNRSNTGNGLNRSGTNRMGGSRSSSGGLGSGSGRSSGGSSFGSSRTGGLGGSSYGGGSGGYGGTFSSGFSRGGSGGGLSSSSQRTAADLYNQVSVIADPDTNSLLVRTHPSNVDRVKGVLEELDRALPQVLIKVLIAEVTHDNGSDIGAEFSVLNMRASGLGQKGGTNFNVAKQSGGLVLQLIESDVTATIRMLESVGKLDVLSRPYILASDNQLASITVGQEVPFITNSRITDTGQTINTIEYDDIGILLDVIPHINPDGLVILDVAPEISALTGTNVPVSDTVSAPVIAKRSAQSRVAIQNGQTVVIGGLMEDRMVHTIDKVPILGDIPLLGEIFKRTQQKKSKTELLIFLTPHVAQRPDSLKEMSKKELEGSQLVPGAVDKKSFQDHKEGMERGHVEERPLPPTTRQQPFFRPNPSEEPEP